MLARAVPEEIDDAPLVAAAIAGSDRAYATLYGRHASYLAGVVYRFLGSDSDVDDIVQEAFVDASRALASLEDKAGFRSWIARIAVRRIYKRLAQRRRFRWLLGAVGEVAPRVSNPADNEAVVALYKVLDSMSPKLRVPWTLHTVEGYTLPEVASICEVSLATVKRRVVEASALVERKLHAAG